MQDEEQENSGDESKTKLVWPVIVLRGNGDICYLNTSVTSTQKPKFEGPLPMYPSADDNYGVEACSILVLETVPSVIVLATSSGTLYHSVLLEIEQSEVNGYLPPFLSKIVKEEGYILTLIYIFISRKV